MHKNYRRKNPRLSRNRYWSNLRKSKQRVLRARSVKRRRKNKQLLKSGLNDGESWDKIRKFEKPVDWWEID
jgi:hypothetical protein